MGVYAGQSWTQERPPGELAPEEGRLRHAGVSREGIPHQVVPSQPPCTPIRAWGYLLLSDVLPLPNEKWNSFLHLCISRAWKALVNNNESRYCTQGSADRNSPAVTCL